ncbi:MAG: AAA family ATPase [Polyangiaceae bacterium]|nr:AAA family ATPase [Polyangiaceae bacterium]
MATRRTAASQSPSLRHTDTFRITDGALGPVPRCDLDIRPFTVLVGRQGTGKSLVAQMLYFFEELPFLVSFVEATERGAREAETREILRWILDQLRSHERAFATFAHPSVAVAWERSAPFEWPEHEGTWALRLSMNKKNRRINFLRGTLDFADRVRRAEGRAIHHALFLPTERMVISQLRTALVERVLSLPLSYTLFSQWLDDVSAVISRWRQGTPDTPEGRRIAEIGESALGGRARRYGDQWKWRFSAGKQEEQFDIDMASSGQRASWSLPYIAQALPTMRARGAVAGAVTLFVEEPEINLHPGAQVDMVLILALLVRLGFRVVITTHSLNVIYALNNLMQASRLGEHAEEGLPEPAMRLAPGDVSVYAFVTGQHPRQLVDIDAKFIDERALGEVAEDLGAALNRIGVLAASLEAQR